MLANGSFYSGRAASLLGAFGTAISKGTYGVAKNLVAFGGKRVDISKCNGHAYISGMVSSTSLCLYTLCSWCVSLAPPVQHARSHQALGYTTEGHVNGAQNRQNHLEERVYSYRTLAERQIKLLSGVIELALITVPLIFVPQVNLATVTTVIAAGAVARLAFYYKGSERIATLEKKAYEAEIRALDNKKNEIRLDEEVRDLISDKIGNERCIIKLLGEADMYNDCCKDLQEQLKKMKGKKAELEDLCKRLVSTNKRLRKHIKPQPL